MYIVTVDQGTSSTKTALWDAGGVPVAEATATYDLERPDAVRAEIDPERWWDALCGTVAEVLAASGVAPGTSRQSSSTASAGRWFPWTTRSGRWRGR